MALALLVLLSTFSFKMETHFCGSKLVDVAVFSKVKSCCQVAVKTSTDFQFTKKSNDSESLSDKKINVYIYPQKEKFIFELNESNNYTFGGEIYNLEQSKNIIIYRLTKDNIKSNKEYITNI